MSVLIEVIITAFISVLISTEEMKTEFSEMSDAQKQVAEVVVFEKCEH